MFYYVVYIGLRINDLTNSQLQTYFFTNSTTAGWVPRLFAAPFQLIHLRYIKTIICSKRGRATQITLIV